MLLLGCRRINLLEPADEGGRREGFCSRSTSPVGSRIYLISGLASPLWIKPRPAIHPEDARLADLF